MASAQPWRTSARSSFANSMSLGRPRRGDLRPDLEFGDGFADAGAATAERTEVLGLVESLKGQLASVDKASSRSTTVPTVRATHAVNRYRLPGWRPGLPPFCVSTARTNRDNPR